MKIFIFQNIDQELQSYNELLQNADELGLVLMQRSTKEEQKDIQEMIDEYQLLWRDIQLRIVQLKLEIEQQVNKPQREVDESVQVETLKFEQDSAIQVDTLSSLSKMTSLTSKDAFLFELTTAVTECIQSLDALEAIVSTPEPQQASPEHANLGTTISKLSANCQSGVELIKHLSSVLLLECGCDEDEAQTSQVNILVERYEKLLLLAKKREQHIRSLRYVLLTNILSFRNVVLIVFLFLLLILFSLKLVCDNPYFFLKQ